MTFKKTKHYDFSKGVNPWFRSKKWPLFRLCFLGNLGQENVFYDIVERENAFLGYKKIFPVGLTHGFGPKMAISPSFFF